jgi:gliding motility-associated-like protein
LGADTTLCENKSLLLEPISPDIARYQWQDGSTASSYLVSKAGNYRLKVFGTNGCTNKDSITISYTALPVVEISGDSVLCGGNPIVLTGKVRNANNFVWQTGSTNAQFTVTDPGMYKITATNMCGTSVAAKIINKGICSLILPNAFTPNGDWTNDIFRIKYPFETRQFLFTIYNRWGEKIFQTKDIKTGWDGTYHGQLQPAGSYIWFISLSDRENHYQQLHGTVLLIR